MALLGLGAAHIIGSQVGRDLFQHNRKRQASSSVCLSVDDTPRLASAAFRPLIALPNRAGAPLPSAEEGAAVPLRQPT